MELPEYLKRLMPFDSHYVQIDGHRLHYIDEGKGDVVVLLHGNPTWCFFYRELIKTLSARFRVIAPDYIGCGLSDHPRDVHFRASHRVKHIEMLLQRLGIEKFSLVMHDWGGSIGSSLAVRHIDQVQRLVYLNTTLTETETLPAIIKLATTSFIGKFLTKYSKQFLRLTTSQGVCRKLPKNVRRGYLFPYRTAARRTAIRDFVSDIPFDSSHPTYSEMIFLAENLPRLHDVPVKIIWGLRDPCFHREMLTKVAHHFPQAEVIEISDASHLVLEDAAHVACPAILEFLSRPSRASGEVAAENNHKSNNDDGAAPGALYSAFLKQVAATPQADAVIEPTFVGDTPHYRHLSFSALALLINKYQRGLQDLGLVAGDRVLMLCPPGAEFLALSYAVMGIGATPFYLDPGMGRDNLLRCIEEINPHAFIGSARAQLLRLKRSKIFPNLKFHVTASEWIFTGGPNLAFLKKFASLPVEPGPGPAVPLVAFTSGGTGMPKGVEFSSEMLRAQLELFSRDFGLVAGSKDLPLLPVFSLFSLALGVCSIFPPIDPARPLNLEAWKIVKLINDLQVDSSFGSPTLWNKIAEYCFRSGDRLPSIKRVFMAGAPVSAPVLERVKSALPEGEVYTPYGSTEALPVTLISSQELKGSQLVCAQTGEQGTLVGKPIAGLRLKIVAANYDRNTKLESLQALSVGEIGEILVAGQNVSRRYYNRLEETSASKLVEGSSFWHRMGDLGYLDVKGNLYFCGRLAHVVKAQGQTFYSVPVERIFNQHERVRRSALVSLDNGVDVGIAVEPEPQYWPETEEEREVFSAELLTLAKSDPLTATINHFFFHPSFPVDGRHNAKIFRDQLSDWATKLHRLARAA